jgi:hypothetical protein
VGTKSEGKTCVTRNVFTELIVNGKHRKKRIYQLEQDEGTILGEENLKVYITEYYKRLFGDSKKK